MRGKHAVGAAFVYLYRLLVFRLSFLGFSACCCWNKSGTQMTVVDDVVTLSLCAVVLCSIHSFIRLLEAGWSLPGVWIVRAADEVGWLRNGTGVEDVSKRK